MSVRYVPVQWTRNKWLYDAVLVVCVAVYVLGFLWLGTPAADVTRPVDGAIARMRAWGSCAFLMLTLVLCIGPLARLDRRFLPLLWNRRHFGVLTALVAFSHAAAVLGWYYAFSPTPAFEAVLTSAVGWDRLLGFPFEILGVFALVILAALAATSHDFWLSFLTPPVWKGLHLLIYPAYAAVVAHVGLGYLQDVSNPAFPGVVFAGALLVAGLHLAALRRGPPAPAAEWIPVPGWRAIPEGRAAVVRVGPDERAAVFRIGGTLSAVSHACAHQNGPLGEGRVIDGCITCPWHGFQYRPEDGRSPAPFTEKIPTYRLKLEGGEVFVHRDANPPGTYEAPLVLPPAEVPA
jgi:nitrite reductase/ring-hydroxylating ferredoxin subunit/DMSO/TMAO reductase YedYZ heme-binding membrane subunit